jgi:Tol biopolymer transport system component
MLRTATILSLIALSPSCWFFGERPPETSGEQAPTVAVESAEACFSRIATALSTDDMEGRGVGTEGLARAAGLIEGELTAAGIPAGEGGYRQTFDIQVGVTRAGGDALSFDGLSAAEHAWSPLHFSSAGAFDGELVFVGYGITAPPLGYDDYAGVDVAGKVVLALRYEPGEDDEASPFEGRRSTRWSDLRYKAFTAREAGAKALIFVEGPAGTDPTADERLPRLEGRGPTSPAGLPVLQLKREAALPLLDAAGLDLAAVQADIDATTTPRSRAMGVQVVGTVALDIELAPADNVLGVLPGVGSLASEYVVVGAHYDHLGHGEHRSMEPGSGEVHNGADDNASGVAAMLCASAELARTVDPAAPRRSLVAMAFAGEELGLLGSAHFVDHPTVPIEDVVAMVNLDMVGRLADGKLRALGTDSAPEWEALLTGPAEELGLQLAAGGDGYGPSDQMAFFSRGVPVVHLFTGAHGEYHTPRDDAELLNMAGGGTVTTFLARLLPGVLQADRRLTYVKSEAAPTLGGDSRGSGAWLGTIPDYTAMEAETGGVLLSGVREGGPAHVAGVLGGDRIVGFDGMAIENLYDLTFALKDHKPGDIAEIVVLRDDAELRLGATLGDRAKMGGGQGSPHGDPHGGGGDWAPTAGKDATDLLDEREVHLADLRQLTFAGENAEAYFSPDGRSLIFQRTPPGDGCDQQYVMDLATGHTTMVSSGRGRTTCGYYDYPDGDGLIWASTAGGDDACPVAPDHSQGYVWALYEDFELVRSGPEGGATEVFLPSPGYDAEATVCFADGRVVFTSVRSGDLDLWVADADGGNLAQLTDLPGYDGGAFFTPDCSEIVWRASRPEGEALADYQALLERGLIRPGALEIYMAEADGTEVRQLTDNGAANFGPYPLPDASGVVFASNVGASPREFDLQRVGRDGGELERITFAEGFDGFPMFSPDGKWLVFGSNRGGDGHETNVFIARWVP